MGNKHSGRRSRTVVTAGVQQILSASASEAAKILSQLIRRERNHLTIASDLQRACEYVIDHAIGKARQKIEHSGGIMTYGDLAKSADKLDEKPRNILADVMDIANKHQPSGDRQTVDEVKPDEKPEL